MNQKETICPRAPTYQIHDLLPKCGRAACFYEITFPVTAVLRSIFCHNVYRQTSITANSMMPNDLLLLLLSLSLPCVLDSHTTIHIHKKTHTIRHPVVPVIMRGMNTTSCGSTLAINRQTLCSFVYKQWPHFSINILGELFALPKMN